MTWFRAHQQEFSFSMETLYEVAGISRQGYFQGYKRLNKKKVSKNKILAQVEKVRKRHPKMGARVLFHKLQIEEMGINKFEHFIASSGLGIKRRNPWIKTTNSNHNLYKYKNLTNGLKIKDIDQLWVSDLTYWIRNRKVFYFIFIMDVYSCFILGYSASDHMRTINNVNAVNMAFKNRGKKRFNNLIHHSDKGSQYCSKEYVGLLDSANIKISMANNSLENPYAERLNGIIKNDYMAFMEVDTLNKAKKALKDVVSLYNYDKPQARLGYLTPGEFEAKLKDIPNEERNEMILHDFNST